MEQFELDFMHLGEIQVDDETVRMIGSITHEIVCNTIKRNSNNL